MKLYVGLFQILMALPLMAQVQLSQLLSDKLYLHVKMEPTQKILETDSLKKLYEPNGFQYLWTENGRPNRSAQILKDILTRADDWGLTSDQYLSRELLNLYDRVTEKNAITLELLLSDAYLKFARDISNGQILDPDLIDEDIKMPRKNFDSHQALVEAVRRPESMGAVLDSLSPQHEKYKALIKVLHRLLQVKAQNTWNQLNDPKIDFKPGAKHSVIVEIKKRLTDLGYPVSNQTNVYDSDLQKAVSRYQHLNSLKDTRTLSRSFFKSLTPSVQDRIDQIKANLEKFRWFPKNWDSRYLLVNMALQEMKVVEDGRTVMEMKTVNGRPTRRTPTMRDEIKRVELSPTWTVPRSIAVKDKLPDLQYNAYALEEMKIKIYDRQDREINPGSVDWGSVTASNFDFTFVQQPGPQNALGLVKFPLTNPWFIYLHDTNEPWLMGEQDRLRSSGCVRLQDAFKLAQYLLQDSVNMSLREMKSPRSSPEPISVRKPLPVYFMYQTVDVTPQGEIRFAHDDYGQDQRLIELFKSRGSREKF